MGSPIRPGGGGQVPGQPLDRGVRDFASRIQGLALRRLEGLAADLQGASARGKGLAVTMVLSKPRAAAASRPAEIFEIAKGDVSYALGAVRAEHELRSWFERLQNWAGQDPARRELVEDLIRQTREQQARLQPQPDTRWLDLSVSEQVEIPRDLLSPPFLNSMRRAAVEFEPRSRVVQLLGERAERFGLSVPTDPFWREFLQPLGDEVERVFQALTPQQQAGAFSFAALWYADRLGGAALAAQRPAGAGAAQESIDPMLRSALPVLDWWQQSDFVPPEPEGSLPSTLHRALSEAQQRIQAGQQAAQELRKALPRDEFIPNGRVRELPWGFTDFKRAFDQYRLKVPAQKWPQEGALLPFDLPTEGRASHRIYVEWLPRSGEEFGRLRIWNAGWGSLPAHNAGGRVWPFIDLAFPDQESLHRALVCLRWMETLPHETRDWMGRLAALTFVDPTKADAHPAQRPQDWYERTIWAKALWNAALANSLREPRGESQPVKAQRSGSCVAKGLRLWLQHSLERYDGLPPDRGQTLSRAGIALLDSVAVQALGDPTLGAGEGLEVRQIRRELAAMTSAYRLAKALSRTAIHALEAAFRQFDAIRLSGVAGVRARPAPGAVAVRREILALESSSALTPSIPGSAASASPSSPAPGAPASPVRLAAERPVERMRKALENLEPMSDYPPAELQEAIRAGSCAVDASDLLADLLFEIHGELVVLKDVSITVPRPDIAPLPLLQTQPVIEQSLQALKVIVQLIPRRPAPEDQWKQADELWDQLPLIGNSCAAWEASPSLELLRERQLSMWKSLQLQMIQWIKEKKLEAAMTPADMEVGADLEAIRKRVEGLRLALFSHPDKEAKDGGWGWNLIFKRVHDRDRQIEHALESFQSHPFAHRVVRWTLDERSALLKRGPISQTPAWMRAGQELRWTAAQASAYAMETPGVQALLRRSVQEGAPSQAFDTLLAWTTPLGSEGKPPSPIGNLITIGGADGWIRWFAALGREMQFNASVRHGIEPKLAALTETLIQGAGEILAPDERRLFEAMAQSYKTLVAEGVNLLDPLVAIHMRLRSDPAAAAAAAQPPPSVDDVFGLIPLGNGPAPFFEHIRVPAFCLRSWQQWGELRERAGVENPWNVQIDQLTYDLHTGKPQSLRVASPCEMRLARLSETDLPPGLKKGTDPVTLRPMLEAQPGYEPWLRVTGEADQYRVEWQSPFARQTVRGRLISLDPDGPRAALPSFSARHGLFPLDAQTFVASGLPEVGHPAAARDLCDQVKTQQGKCPGIFQTAKIVEWDEPSQTWRWSTVREGTLQQTARLERSPQESSVLFPDGERIALADRVLFGNLSTIGAGDRVILEDLHQDGEPIRGRVISAAAAEPYLELDNGWRVSPELRAELPAFLANIPFGAGRDEGIAMPLQRGRERGLLIAAPFVAGKSETGRALFFSVLPSGDVIPDPQTSASALIAALPHLASRAPLLAQRVMQWLSATRPELLEPDSNALYNNLQRLQKETGQLIAPFAQRLWKDWFDRSNRGNRAQDQLLGVFPLRGDISVPIQVPDQRRFKPPVARRQRIQPLPARLTSQVAIELAKDLRAKAQDAVKQAERELARALDEMPERQRAYVLATAQDLWLPTLLQAWFSTTQSGRLEPWGTVFPGLDVAQIDRLQWVVGSLAEALASEGAAQQAVDAALDYDKALTAERGAAASSTAQASAEAEVRSALEAGRAHLEGKVPAALWRKEFIEARLGRPAQVETLRRVLAPVPGVAAQLVVVPMGGGKTSVLNPTLALEWAAERAADDRRKPVLLVVPDNLEEDVRQLCRRQAWGVLLNGTLPFAGTGTSATEVIAMSRRAAEQGLPLTLTQSAWNFAWLELLRETTEPARGPQRDAAKVREDLDWLTRASLILDEADEALALEQSYNLQLGGSRPLPGALVRALNGLAGYQFESKRALLHPLTTDEKRELLRQWAPAAWRHNLTEDVVALLLSEESRYFSTSAADVLVEASKTSRSELEPLLFMAELLTQSLPAAAQMRYREDFGPANRSDLETVPYRYADWPSDQKFSDPVLLGVLTLEQAANPDTWTLERAASLSSLLSRSVLEDLVLRTALAEEGFSLEVLNDPNALQNRLVQGANSLQCRLLIGLLLCQLLAKTSADSISLAATGAPSRSSRCVAVTGTAPSPARVPTMLLGAAPAAAAGASQPGILAHVTCSRSGRAGSATDRLRELVAQKRPDIVIDPNGLLSAEQARSVVMQMAEQKATDQQRPVALTWSAGTSKSAPALQQILPSGVPCAPPAPEALETRPKCAVYQQAQCRGTDLKPGRGEQGLMLLETVLPLRDLQQAAARLRGLVPDRSGNAVQTLEIVLGPDVQAQVDELKSVKPQLSDRDALVQLAAKLDEEADRLSLRELLEQDLINLYQAAGVEALKQGLQNSRPFAEHVSPLIESLKSGYRLSTLEEMVGRAKGTISRKKHLSDEGRKLTEILSFLRNSCPTPESGAPWERLFLQAGHWLNRLDRWQEPRDGTLRSAVKTAVVHVVEQAVEQEAEAQRAIHAQREVPRGSDQEYLADAVLASKAKLGADLNVEGVLRRDVAISADESGVFGFREYWSRLEGREEELLLEGWSLSPAALMPFGLPLDLDSPLRLAPLVLHIRRDRAWERHLISPQEAAEMRRDAFADWGKAAGEGNLVLCQISGERLTGAYGPERAPDTLQEEAWKKHLSDTSRSLRRVRALFGDPIPSPFSDLQEQQADQQWLKEHQAWCKVWLDASPDRVRGSRAGWAMREGIA